MAAFLVIAIPVALAIASMTDGAGQSAGQDSTGQVPDTPGTDDTPAPGEDGDGGGDGDAQPPVPEDGQQLDRPDVEQLAGVDAAYGRVLLAVDDAEHTMMAFQSDIAEAFAGAADPQDAPAAAQDAAARHGDQLAMDRDVLTALSLDDPGAEVVRETYLAHLDAWADYMAAVVEDPSVLAAEGEGAQHTVQINATADDFARVLEREMPDDLGDEVRAFAEAILERGFRDTGTSEV